MNSGRMSVIDRLESMPEIFDLRLFCLKTGIDRSSAKVMLSRWGSRGYIEIAGPKSGIYFKRLGSSLDRSEQIIFALRQLYPSATLCGASVLHRAGWTSQIPRQLHVAIESRPSFIQLNDVVLYERSIEWFRIIGSADGFATESCRAPTAMRSLRPAWALADMQIQRDGWLPDDDDLDLPDGAAEEVEVAMLKMGGTVDHNQERARVRER